jgi:hypothetical protein
LPCLPRSFSSAGRSTKLCRQFHAGDRGKFRGPSDQWREFSSVVWCVKVARVSQSNKLAHIHKTSGRWSNKEARISLGTPRVWAPTGGIAARSERQRILRSGGGSATAIQHCRVSSSYAGVVQRRKAEPDQDLGCCPDYSERFSSSSGLPSGPVAECPWEAPPWQI